MNNIFFKKNKKIIIICFLIIVILVIGFFISSSFNKKKELKALAQKQKLEEARQLRVSGSTWSRVSFFENLPINVSLAIPSYLEGNYRLVKGVDQVSFLYIKNPETPTPLLYLKVFKKNEFKLGKEEREIIKPACPNYVFVYHLYSDDSYEGEYKNDFAQAIFDINFYLEGDGFFECRLKN